MRTVDEAATDASAYDYVFVCIKALPDVYNLGEVIRPVITPSHTCIIVNTTTAIGVEPDLMEMYPRNMVLSLCSGIELVQTGPTEFVHVASHPVQVGALRINPTLPKEAQQDMTESLSLTLDAGAVECVSTTSIEKFQWERIIGLIAFHPISVILKEPNHSKLWEDPDVNALINGIFDECLSIAEARSATFPYDFKTRSLQTLSTMKESKSTMYQDFLAGRPLELEVYLAIPIKLAEQARLETPHLRSMYALLKYINTANQQRPPLSSTPSQTQGRLVPQHTGQSIRAAPRASMNRGMTDPTINGGRAMSMVYGPPPNNGHARGPPVQARRAPNQITRQESLEGLEEFATVAMYNDLVPSGDPQYFGARDPAVGQGGLNHAYPSARQARPMPSRASTSQGYYPEPQGRGYEQKQRQQPRQGAFASMGKKMSNMRLSGRGKQDNFDDEDDDEDDYVDSAPVSRGPAINPDQVDMLAMTRRGKASVMANRSNGDRTPSFAIGRPKMKQSKSGSQALMNDIPGIHDAVTNSVLFGMGDNRYGTVDSRTLANSANGRLNSMQSERLNSISSNQLMYGPNNPHSPPARGQGPPNTMNSRGMYQNGGQYRGPGQYNSVNATLRGQLAPQAQRQQAYPQSGNFPPGKGLDPNMVNGTRSVTGSASASFGSLGNGSNSHSSSSSRDEIPAPAIAR